MAASLWQGKIVLSNWNKFAGVDGQQGKCSKDIIDFIYNRNSSRKTSTSWSSKRTVKIDKYKLFKKKIVRGEEA